MVVVSAGHLLGGSRIHLDKGVIPDGGVGGGAAT